MLNNKFILANAICFFFLSNAMEDKTINNKLNEIIHEVYQKTAILNRESNESLTPLMCSLKYYTSNYYYPFLNKNNINAQTSKGTTALMIAIKTKNFEAYNDILAIGADPNIRDTSGKTALMYAVENNNIEATSALLKHHATVLIRNQKMKTALDIAKEKEYHILELLLANAVKNELMTSENQEDLVIAEKQSENCNDDLMLLAEAVDAHEEFENNNEIEMADNSELTLGKRERKTIKEDSRKKQKLENQNLSFSCPICSKSFETNHGYNKHKSIHNSQVFCEICKKSFRSIEGLNKHKINHTPELNVICTYDGCDKVFKNDNALLVHYSKVHKNNHSNNYTCKFCGKVFRGQSSLSNHENSHTANRPFACNYPGCNKAFTQSGNLTRHKNSHKRREKIDIKIDVKATS